MADDHAARPLNVFEQGFGIMFRWPGTVRIVRVQIEGEGVADELRWTTTFTPTKFSCTYTVEFAYKVGDPIVRVEVVDPALDPGAGKQLPHVYREASQCWLCLHLDGQWDPSMPISTTVVPWAAEWLLHYEIWLATGEWTGSGDRYRTDLRPLDGLRLRHPAAQAAPFRPRSERRAKGRAGSRP